MVRAAGQFRPHVVTHRPADNFPGEEIEHRGQIEPPFLGWHVGKVGEPNLIDFKTVSPSTTGRSATNRRLAPTMRGNNMLMLWRLVHDKLRAV